MVKLPNSPLDGFSKIIASQIDTVNITKTINKLFAEQAEQLKSITESLNKLFSPLLESAQKVAHALKDLDKAGLTPNLGENRSIWMLKHYQKLMNMGYAIFWVPREEVINQLIAARTVTEKKNVLITHRMSIIEDCRKVVDEIDTKNLKDHKAHLLAALDALVSGNDRAAQSAANVCFDALFDHLVDESTMQRFGEVNAHIKTSGQQLKGSMRIPAKYLYAALQAELVLVTLRDFNRLNPRTVSTKYARNASTHSVSSRQFTEHNALQAVMIATSLLATTDRLGRNWMTNLARYA